MKCNNCGSVLLVGTTVCPYCQSPQNASNEQSAPVNGTDTMMASPMPEQTPQVAPQEAIMDNQNVGENLTGMGMETPVAPAAPVDVEMPAPAAPAPEAPVAPAPMPEAPVAPAPMPEAPVAPAAPTPSMEGAKIANVDPVEKKKSKKATLIIAIVVVVVAALAAVAYFYEFKSADKRIDNIFNYLTKKTANYDFNKITKSSGKYSIDANANVMGEEAKIGVEGTYGVDIDNKVIDFTLDVKNLYLSQDLLPEALKTVFYINDDKMYVSIPNFYDKFISMPFENSDDLFSMREQEYDYNAIINGVVNALKAGVKAMDNKQGVESITLDGKKQTANVITINLTAANQTKFINAVLDSIKNNDLLLQELAKASGVTVEMLKESLTNDTDTSSYTDANMVVKIASPLVGNDLLGITVEPTDNNMQGKIEYVVVDDGCKLIVTAEGTEINLEITEKETNTSDAKTTESTIKGSITANGQSITLDAKAVITEDKNPVINKRNVKDAISIENMTQADFATIGEKFTSFGSLGSLITTLIPGMGMTPDYSLGDSDFDTDFDFDTNYDIDVDDDYDFNFDPSGNVSIPRV